MILEGEIKDAKMNSFSSHFQTLMKQKFPLHFRYELLMSLRSSFLRCLLLLALIPTAAFVLSKSSSFVEKDSVISTG